MDDPIETQLFNAWNKVTGARLTRDMLPIDMQPADYRYESPRFGVKARFSILTIEDGLVLECYELIIKAFTSHYGVYYTPDSSARFHIYEAEKRAFDHLWFRHRPRSVRPGAIAELDAKLVL